MILLRRVFLSVLVFAVLGGLSTAEAKSKPKLKPEWATVTVLNAVALEDDLPIDVDVNGEERVRNLKFGKSKSFKLLPGTYDFEVFEDDGDEFASQFDQTIEPCGDYTLLVFIGVGEGAFAEAILLKNDLSPAEPHKARIVGYDYSPVYDGLDLDWYGTYAKSTKTVLLDPSTTDYGDTASSNAVPPGKLTLGVYDTGTTTDPYATTSFVVAPKFLYNVYLVPNIDDEGLVLLVEKRLLKLK